MLNHFIIVLVGWIILMLIGTNLVGLVVRGLFSNPNMEELKRQDNSFINNEVKKYEHANVVMTLFFSILSVLYLYLLLYFWNIGVATAAIMLMVSRVPDLLVEIRTGRVFDRKSPTKGFVYTLATLLNWAALPVLWWAL